MGGPDSLKYFQEAAAVYREALTVATPEMYPQDRVDMEASLGTVLQDLGRAAELNGTEYFKDAEAILRETQTVSRHKAYPQEWAQVQVALASNRYVLKDVSGAVELLTAVLSQEPDSEEAFKTLSGLYHDVLFDFAAADALTERWLVRHVATIPVQVNFAESQFTVGLYNSSDQFDLNSQFTKIKRERHMLPFNLAL